jgi:hypothetical protein
MFMPLLHASIDLMIRPGRRGMKWLMRGGADTGPCSGIQPTVSTSPIQIIFNPRYSELMIEYRQAGIPSYGDVIKVANPGLSRPP